jgi:outer membrane beta-barrel protein
MMKSLLILLACYGSHFVHADDIEFPEEELARETTLPVFEKRRVVLNRHVVTDKHIELGIGGGIEMNEPYYSDWMGQLVGTYNLNDTSAINLTGLFWTSGLSSYGEQLKQGTKNPVRESFDASKAPHPQWGVFGNYEFIAYYGKISVTKQTVMNLNMFGILGLGYINMDPLNTVGLNVGLGQNFFFTQNIGLRMDLRWLIFQGPNATTQHLRTDSTNNDHPSAGSFGNRIYYNSQLGLSLLYIL